MRHFDLSRLRGLYGIAGPWGHTQDAALATARALVTGGAAVLQLRDKTASGTALLETARQMRRLAQEWGALFVVNDRLDIALLAEADGVHLGQDDLPVSEARRLAASLLPGRPFLVGLSTHDLEQVKSGVGQGADYLGFGPVFPTSTKTDALEARGVERLREAVQAAGGVPVVAIGGVTLERAELVLQSGAAMGAVISEVASAADPAGRAAALHEALGGLPPGRR